MMSRQENARSNSSNTGAVSPMIQAIEASKASRLSTASARPSRRAESRRSSGNRPTRIAMKTRLSIPSTISSAVSVTRLAQIFGSASHSIRLASDRCQRKEAVKRLRGRKNGASAGRRSALAKLALRLVGGASQLDAQLRLGHLDPLGREIAPDLFDDVAVAGLFEIRIDDGSRIGLGLVAGGDAESARRPQSEQPVAARGDPELQLLAALELGLEPFLPVFETLHVVSS